MKPLILITILTFFSSCRLFENYEPIPCPYNVKSTSHRPLIPLVIQPHSMHYKLGDTMKISIAFRDSVFDVSTDQTFLMKNFPFDPGVKLWRFENDSTWENGLLVNEILMDKVYYQRLDKNDDYVGILFVDFVEKDNMYRFEMDIVLQKKGRYIFQFEDFINRYPGDYYDEKIGNYTFEGKCGMGIRPVAMIQGDDHIDAFEKELLYIDKKLFYDNYTTIKVTSTHMTPYGRGTMFWEFVGTYGFEVR